MRWASGIAALCTVSLLAGGCAADEDDPYVAPTSAPSSDAIDAVSARDTLRILGRALHRRDDDAVAAIGSAGGVSLLGSLADNVAELELTGVGFRYLGETGSVSADGGWTGRVEVTWRYRGFDRVGGRTTVVMGFDADGSHISSITAYDAAWPLWLAGPVVAARGERALAVAAEGGADPDRYLALAERAVVEVGRVLGRVRGGLVVEVPATPEALNAAVDADPGTYDAIAAVSASSDGSMAPGSALHVFVNPSVFGGLDEVAGQVVMTHEAVHVVTEAPLSAAELWLLEGFADYVALRDTDLPWSRTAGQIIDQVVEDGVPEILPARPQFDSRAAELGALYEGAWLVCVTLADRGGEDALVEFYRAVNGGGSLEGELERIFGWTLDDLTAAWQDRLRTLAGVQDSQRG